MKANTLTEMKKLFSLVLAFCMVMSGLSFTAFADDDFPDQLPGGAFVANDEGELEYDENAGDTLYYKDGVVAGEDDYDYMLEKSIVQTGENEFKITLKVVTAQTITTTYDKSATVLVIDTSGSMNDDGKLASAKNAAKEFLDVYSGKREDNTWPEGAQQWLRIVTFAGSGNYKTEWLNVATQSGYVAAEAAINAMSATGGTNLHDGLRKAQDALGNAAVSDADIKNVVVLTDGAATYHMHGNTRIGNGYNGTPAHNNAAKGTADAIKNAGATVYTVCFGAENTPCFDGNYFCAHCGNRWEEHNGYYRYCPDSSGNTYSGKHYDNITCGNFLAGSIASPGKAYNVETAGGSLEDAFKAIGHDITSGQAGEGTQVTDPAGQYISFDVTDEQKAALIASGIEFAEDGNSFTWELDPDSDLCTKDESDPNHIIYTYTFDYNVTLDPTVEGFDENANHPTNGRTFLSIPSQTPGEAPAELDFNVPAVTGTVPMVNYTIKFFKQNADGEGYTEVADDAITGSAKLHTIVNAPANYSSKYDDDDYFFKQGPISMKLGKGENVLELYYDRITTTYTVIRHFELKTINADGTEATTNPADVTEGPTGGFVGDTASVANYNANYMNGGVSYEFDHAAPNDASITLVRDADSNVIELWYKGELDLRAWTMVKVKHIYRTHTWALENGKYILKDTATDPLDSDPVNQNQYRATTKYTASELEKTRLAAYDGYLYDENNIDYVILAEDASSNVITLYFDKTVDDRETAEITVRHHYTKSVTSVDADGNVTTVINPNNHVETETIDKHSNGDSLYVGESYIVSEIPGYDDDTYTPAVDNAAKLPIASLGATNEIDLYYTITELPEPGKVTVNHYYYTKNTETRAVKDADGNVTGTEEVVTYVLDEQSEGHVIEGVIYVGQSYTAPFKGKEGYTFSADAFTVGDVTYQSDEREGKAGTDTIVNLYYIKDTSSDNRDAATLEVTHKYVTYRTTIVNGAVGVVLDTEGPTRDDAQSITEADGKKAGDAFSVNPVTDHNGHDDWVRTDTNPLSGILQAGTNNSIDLVYEREDSDLVETSYSIHYVYRVNEMFIDDDGKADWKIRIESEEDADPEDLEDPVYVGQRVTLLTGAKEGYTPEATNPDESQILGASGNAWTFVHTRQEKAFDKVKVNVIHHYTTITIGVNGESDGGVTTDAPMPEVEKYKGERFVALAAAGDFDYVSYSITEGVAATQDDATKDVTFDANGNVTVHFYYTKTVNNSKAASYTVKHVYETYAWNDSVTPIATDTSEEPPVNSFATVTVTANPSFVGNFTEVFSASFNGAALTASPYNGELVEGENEFIFVYRYTQPRNELDVRVIHEYYNEAVAEGNLVGTYELNDKAYEESVYTAELKPVFNGRNYTFTGTEADRSIEIGKDGEYVIVLKYVFVEQKPPVDPPVNPPVNPPVDPDDEPEDEPDAPVLPETPDTPDDPEPPADIPEDDVPLADLPEEDVPLADVPKTGDNSMIWLVLTFVSAICLAVLTIEERKSRLEEMQ